MNKISVTVISYFALMSIYFRFGQNPNCTFTDIELISGSYYFIVQSLAFIAFGFISLKAAKSSIDAFALYSFIAYNALLLIRELAIIITKNVDMLINSWQASFILTGIVLTINIFICFIWKR